MYATLGTLNTLRISCLTCTRKNPRSRETFSSGGRTRQLVCGLRSSTWTGVRTEIYRTRNCIGISVQFWRKHIVEEKGSIYIRVHDSDNNFKNNIVIPREGAGKVLDVIRQHFVEHKNNLNREIEEM